MPTAKITGTGTHAGYVVEFITIRPSAVPQPGQNLELIDRRGFNGMASRKSGRKGQAFSVQGVTDCLDDAAAYLAVGKLSVLQGETVSYTNDHGRQYDMTLLQVAPIEQKKIAGSVGGTTAASTIILTVQMVMQELFVAG